MAYTSSSSMPLPARDPMIDYYALYAHKDPETPALYSSSFPNSVYLQGSELNNKLWELRRVIDWINEECEDVVLVQRSSDGPTWLLVFVSIRDYSCFNSWYSQQTVTRYTVSLPTPERETEYQDWMIRNIYGRKRVASVLHIDGKKSVTVSVADPNEELLFKLRWVGVPDEEEDA
jgi:hypothetical protein